MITERHTLGTKVARWANSGAISWWGGGAGPNPMDMLGCDEVGGNGGALLGRGALGCPSNCLWIWKLEHFLAFSRVAKKFCQEKRAGQPAKATIHWNIHGLLLIRRATG